MSYSNFIVEFSKLNEFPHETNIPYSTETLKLFYQTKTSWIDKFHLKDENKIIILIGNPIFQKKINKDFLIKKLKLQKSYNRVANLLNGSFLIIIFHLDEKKLIIINDRFAGYPFFYFSVSNQIIDYFFF